MRVQDAADGALNLTDRHPGSPEVQQITQPSRPGVWDVPERVRIRAELAHPPGTNGRNLSRTAAGIRGLAPRPGPLHFPDSDSRHRQKGHLSDPGWRQARKGPPHRLGFGMPESAASGRDAQGLDLNVLATLRPECRVDDIEEGWRGPTMSTSNSHRVPHAEEAKHDQWC